MHEPFVEHFNDTTDWEALDEAAHGAEAPIYARVGYDDNDNYWKQYFVRSITADDQPGL